MAFYLKLEEGQPQQLAQTYKRYICLHLFKCDINLHSGLLILYIYPRKAHLTRSKKKRKKRPKSLWWNSHPLFVSCILLLLLLSISGRALAESARQPYGCPATSRTGRWSSLSWLCWSPRRTPSTTHSLSRCCRAPLWPSAAPRGPASPGRSGPFALARKGCGTSAADDAGPSRRWRRRWWWRRWRPCQPLSHPRWWWWSHTWRGPGCGPCWRSSRQTWSTRMSGTGPFWLPVGFVHHSGRNTWTGGKSWSHISTINVMFYITKRRFTHLFPSSFSVTTTSMTCQKAPLFTFFPSLVMWPMQMPAISPTCFDENSNVSVAPLRKTGKTKLWNACRVHAGFPSER